MEYHIDCTHLNNAGDLHRQIAVSLSFPCWYGHNLDALYDLLTEIGTPTHLILQNWDDTFPFSPGFRSVFEDVALDNPNIRITFA